jgi:DNA repair/transcription protein MET18/MMS19
MIRTLSLPSAAERAHAITSLESLLETSNASSAVDSLVHRYAETIVEGLLKSVGEVPEMGSSAVSPDAYPSFAS